jgi:hypothetical protein
VELHVRATDWIRHGHTGDPHYQRVVLHVVWENDTAGTPGGIPVLVLCDRTPGSLLPRYHQFMTSQCFVPCERLLPAADISWPAFRHTLLLRRLGHRTAFIRTLLDENRPHWDETIFRLIARSLGQPVNTDAFLEIAKGFSLTFLLRRRSDTDRLETFFLEKAASLAHPLSFSRMRPAHSPHIRLRQLAAILTRYSGWFTMLLESDHPGALLQTLDVDGLGAQTKQSILINAHIPLLYAYGILRQEQHQRDKALRWLGSLPPEDNTVIRRWLPLGMTVQTAADTQALLELKKNLCDAKGCLDCAIGQALLISAPGTTSPLAAPAPTPSPASETPPSPPCRDGYCT